MTSVWFSFESLRKLDHVLTKIRNRISSFLRHYWVEFFVALHLVKMAYFFRNVDIASEFPIVNHDFMMYYARALRVQEFFFRSGRFWGYDPFDMAGYVSGPIHEAGTHLLSILCYLLTSAMPIRTSLLFFEFLGFFSLPFLLMASVRNWDGSRMQAGIGLAIGVLMIGAIEPLSADFLPRGVFGFLVASSLAVWQISLGWKWLENKGWSDLIFLIIVSSCMFQLHPLSILIVIVPNFLCYVLKARSLKAIQHLQALVAVLVFVGSVWYWVAPCLGFLDWKVSVPNFMTTGLKAIDPIFNPLQSSWISSARVILSGLLFYMAGCGAFEGLRSKPMQTVAILSSFFCCAIVAFFGSHILYIQDLQPARFIVPMWLFVYLLAALSFRFDLFSRSFSFSLVALAMFSFLFCLKSGPAAGLVTHLTKDQESFIRYLRKEGPFPGRLLLECDEDDAPIFNDAISILTGQPMLGGSNPGNFLKTRSTVFAGSYFNPDYVGDDPVVFGKKLKKISESEFAAYLDLYNVCIVAVRSTASIKVLNQFSDNLVFRSRTGGYNIYAVKRESNWFHQGSGALTFDYDQLLIRNASTGHLTLKCHLLATLRTRPELPIHPVYLKDDPVPFISIDNSAATNRIAIYNAGLTGGFSTVPK